MQTEIPAPGRPGRPSSYRDCSDLFLYCGKFGGIGAQVKGDSVGTGLERLYELICRLKALGRNTSSLFEDYLLNRY